MYDPMVAKLIVWDADREQATTRMLRALEEFEIEELKTLIPFHKALLATEQWARGETCRDLLEDRKWLKSLAYPAPAAVAGAEQEPPAEHGYAVEVSGRRFDVRILGGPPTAAAGSLDGAGAAAQPLRSPPRRSSSQRGTTGGGGGPDTLP